MLAIKCAKCGAIVKVCSEKAAYINKDGIFCCAKCVIIKELSMGCSNYAPLNNKEANND